MRFYFLLILFSCTLFAKVLSPNEAFVLKSSGNSIYIELGDEIYLYQKELKLMLNDKDLTNLLTLPEAVNIKSEKRYYKELVIRLDEAFLQEQMANLNEAYLSLLYQGCSESGFCYRPYKAFFKVQKNGNFFEIQTLIFNETKNLKEFLGTKEAKNSGQDPFDKAFYLTLLSFFGYGLLLSLTPCTLPMIPILSSIILAKSGEKPSKKRAFWLSFVYVFCMSLAYALAGILSASFGASIQGLLQKPVVLVGFAFVFVLLALACFGLFSLQISTRFQGFLSAFSNKFGGVLGVAIMGFLSALIIGPCVAPALVAALLYIAESADFVLGGAALFALSFGMGVPLLFVGLGLGFLRQGAWTQKVNKFFGFLMLFMAVWLLSRFMDMSLILMAYGLLLVFFAAFMGLYERVQTAFGIIKKTALIVLFFYGLMLFFGGIFGGKNVLNPLQIGQGKIVESKEALGFEELKNLNEIRAKISTSKKPVMLYFTALWCENCKLLDALSFSDERVQGLLSGYELVKIDITKASEAELEIMKAYEVFAPPVMLFFENGILTKQIIGFVSVEELLQRLEN